MAVYSVYLPTSGRSSLRIAERTEFVREGFCWRALAFGPFWLMWHRLWRPFLVYIAGVVGIGAAVGSLGLSPVSALLLLGLMDWYLGCEGAGMIGARLRRRRFRLADVVTGSKMDEVERRFFTRWQPGLEQNPVKPAPGAAR